MKLKKFNISYIVSNGIILSDVMIASDELSAKNIFNHVNKNISIIDVKEEISKNG